MAAVGLGNQATGVEALHAQDGPRLGAGQHSEDRDVPVLEDGLAIQVADEAQHGLVCVCGFAQVQCAGSRVGREQGAGNDRRCGGCTEG